MNLLLLLALVSPAMQMTHPCDTVNPTAYKFKVQDLPTLKVGFCFIPLTIDGMVLTEPVGFMLQVSTKPAVDLGYLTPLGGPNSRGEFYYEVQTPLAAGTIAVWSYTTLLGPSATTTVKLATTGKPPR